MLKTLSKLSRGQRVALVAVIVAVGDLLAESFEAYSGPITQVIKALAMLVGAGACVLVVGCGGQAAEVGSIQRNLARYQGTVAALCSTAGHDADACAEATAALQEALAAHAAAIEAYQEFQAGELTVSEAAVVIDAAKQAVERLGAVTHRGQGS